MSEYEEQMARFEKGMKEPDETIDAHSLAKLTDKDGNEKYYFLTRDGRCVLVELDEA